MKTIRQNVFETNSSSSHSVTIVAGNRENICNDLVKLERGEFGWEYMKHSDIFTKLSFAYTLAAPLNWSDDVGYLKPTTREMWMLDGFLREELGAKRIIYSGKGGYVDHSSEWVKNVIFADSDTLADFLLNDKSYLQLDYDNRDNYYTEKGKGTRNCQVYDKTVTPYEQ